MEEKTNQSTMNAMAFVSGLLMASEECMAKKVEKLREFVPELKEVDSNGKK